VATGPCALPAGGPGAGGWWGGGPKGREGAHWPVCAAVHIEN